MSLPRLLVIMGSGETSPTMVKTHREVFARLSPAGPAVLLDTPFGFQENADDIAARAVAYFRGSVGRPVEVASFRRASGLDPVAREEALARIHQAEWVFAGPGSPTYTLRQWAGSEIPDLLADKLRHGGVINFASAAALTLGVVTVPVYEIYKVGAEVAWAPGLDLIGSLGLGLNVAVIPHYDNAEGGNHDTRFCYLGERRLRLLEALLPADAFVLGVDEHTGCVFDLDLATATVVGLGQVTVRRGGCSSVVATGVTLPIEDLVALSLSGSFSVGGGERPADASSSVVAGSSGRSGAAGAGAAAGAEMAGTGVGMAGAVLGTATAGAASAGTGAVPGTATAGAAGAGTGAVPGTATAGAAGAGMGAVPGTATAGAAGAGAAGSGTAVSPLLAAIRRYESAFDAAVGGRDVDGAVRAILSLDDELAAWGADTLQSDEQDRGRGALRRMVVGLGELARAGARDPRSVIEPYVAHLLAVRDSARQGRRFEEADGIRDRLVSLGVEIRDTPEGTQWDPPCDGRPS